MMATAKKGFLTRSAEWWKHLRSNRERQFWPKHRKTERRIERQARLASVGDRLSAPDLGKQKD